MSTEINSMSSLAGNISRRRIRTLKDRMARYAVTFGGIGVIVAIMLIFFYLLLVVMPLFESAEVTKAESYPVSADVNGEIMAMAVEEQAEIGVRIVGSGQIEFFDIRSGDILDSVAVGDGKRVAAVAISNLADDIWIVAFENAEVLFVKAKYTITYPDNQRLITPAVVYPLGEQSIRVLPENEAGEIRLVAGSVSGDAATIMSVLEDGRLIETNVELERNFLSDEIEISDIASHVIELNWPDTSATEFLVMDPLREWITVAGRNGDAMILRRRNNETWLNERVRLTDVGERLTALVYLTGGISLLAGTDSGAIHQWFPVRTEGVEYQFRKIRSFDATDSPVTSLASEHRRKGFVSGHANGEIGVHYTTSGRVIRQTPVADAPITILTIAPRANHVLAVSDNGQITNVSVHNEHPEISWASLWGKIWYESYPEPDYVWQSSSASNDFEPKFSLVPLSFGTLKAAFYAMLLAMPLAIMGAIYTAYFMTPGLRRLVKPTVEVMEALPTVILGFLAGLWLAPMMEANLPAIVLLLFALPIGMLLTGFGWSRLPVELRSRIPAGWEAAILMLPVMLIGWLAFSLSTPIENLFFHGNMPHWISTELGISFDQRNAMVVGVAMGFAVIPTIFSIAEDAIFGVPKHLSYGSLALGATPWQTLVNVVLPTASPGIFSGVMIGFGRAVGETMIVLMATGNTPVMDLNIFQGMRTLSANIAVEMPESEVGSTHYRVLFLAALVLFVFTFIFNTGAELIRQRLRDKYSAI